MNVLFLGGPLHFRTGEWEDESAANIYYVVPPEPLEARYVSERNRNG